MARLSFLTGLLLFVCYGTSTSITDPFGRDERACKIGGEYNLHAYQVCLTYMYSMRNRIPLQGIVAQVPKSRLLSPD